MAYFILTYHLMDVIRASAPARIVNVSSMAHYGRTINFDDLQNKQRYSPQRVYGQSKLLNILFTYELARRLEGSGVTANTLHPGVVATQFAANNWGPVGKLARRVLNIISISAEKGAQTTLYLATSPDVEGVSGEYFDTCRVKESSPASHDQEAQRRLWTISEQIAGLDMSIM
jgi:NAD(P)-dependent dehydrogenase (short-subunit alcohol dehydrogenase family)